MRRLLTLLLAMLLAALASASASAAGVQDKADREAIRTLQRQLRSPVLSVRVQAIRELRDYPIPEIARLLVPAALADPEEEIRRAATNTLLSWKNERAIQLVLLKNLGHPNRPRKDDLWVTTAIVAVLLASEVPETQEDLKRILESYAARGPEGVLVLTSVADELGKQGTAESLEGLVRMTRLDCFAQVFACRRAVIQAMIQLRLPEAVPQLIALLAKVDGEARGDILAFLGEISGEPNGTSAEAWQAWWTRQKDHFQFPSTALASPGESRRLAGLPSYYGLPILARRMVFVIDISGSMQGPRLAAAQRELIQAIEALPQDSYFTIVTFNSQIGCWKSVLAAATTAAKQSARQFVYGLHASAKTDAYDALDVAFRTDAEAIYFLSDGEPNCGTISDPVAIVAAVSRANRARRITINSIGILPGAPGGPFEQFLKTLAAQNYGQYRRTGQ